MKKKSLKMLAAIAIFALFSFTIQDNLKFGYLNSQLLLQELPQRKAADAKLDSLAKGYESDLEIMQVEFNKAYNDLVEKGQTMSELMQKTKQQELGEMQQRMQQFSNEAQKDLQVQREALLKPILEKVENAINKVSKDNGYLLVFDVNQVLYINNALATDLMPEVKKELKIN